MSKERDRLDQMEFDRQKAEAIEKLRRQCACRCVLQGHNTKEGRCSFCGTTPGIAKDKQEEYDRGLKKIEEDFTLS